MKESEDLKSLWEKVFNNFKKLSPALLAIVVASALILFLPQTILSKMALDKIPDIWKTVVGLIFILSVALLVTIVITEIIAKILKEKKTKKIKKALKNNLTKLSKDQKIIVLNALQSKDKKITLDPTSGDVAYLVGNCFLHQMDPGMFFGPGYMEPVTYCPEPWLIELYNSEPELFQ